jgi:hypothetical protein
MLMRGKRGLLFSLKRIDEFTTYPVGSWIFVDI